VSEGD
jgi:mRNA interferase RelE/StbE